MRSFIQEIPKYFDFQDCSILFHDNEKDQLYTITFGDDEDIANYQNTALKFAKDQKEKEYLESVFSMKDALLTANGMILFPISFGISSEVFKSG